jgi:hypothetical protein
MRLVLILAVGLGATGAAHAQIQPPKNPYAISPPTIGSTTMGGAFKPYEGYQAPKAYQPYDPAKSASVDGEGPFSPAGEARRQRKAEAAERARANGAFSPAGEAKREREQAKRDKTISPF